MSSSTLTTPTKPRWHGTPEDVIAALRRTHGMIAIAARELGCDRSTIHSYANRFASVRNALADARELTTDTAELALYKAIQEGQGWAVCFYLKTQGRDRGYVERHEQEVTGRDGGPIEFTFTIQRARSDDDGDRAG